MGIRINLKFSPQSGIPLCGENEILRGEIGKRGIVL